METGRNQVGIQQLLAAEQEAQYIVNDARNAKLVGLKQAKDETDREINQFRYHLDREFHMKEVGSSGDSSCNAKRLEQETKVKINQLKNQAASISPDVINMLLKHITTLKN